MTRTKLPRNVRASIEAALRVVKSDLRQNCAVPEEHQEAMRLYLDTWAAGPLQHVLLWDDGDRDAYLDWNRDRPTLRREQYADD